MNYCPKHGVYAGTTTGKCSQCPWLETTSAPTNQGYMYIEPKELYADLIKETRQAFAREVVEKLGVLKSLTFGENRVRAVLDIAIEQVTSLANPQEGESIK